MNTCTPHSKSTSQTTPVPLSRRVKSLLSSIPAAWKSLPDPDLRSKCEGSTDVRHFDGLSASRGLRLEIHRRTSTREQQPFHVRLTSERVALHATGLKLGEGISKVSDLR